MEQLIDFNGVKVLLTTGQTQWEVQNFWDEADVVFSVYPHAVQCLKCVTVPHDIVRGG
jgi:hypothetical protein